MTPLQTLAFTVLLLAAIPAVQEWIAEELRRLPKLDALDWIAEQLNPDSVTWNHESTFSKCKRCRAVLVETLRLYPLTMSLPKWSNENPQRLQIIDKTLVVPPNTEVMPSLLAIQTDPEYWPDPLIWRPSRWIKHTQNGTLEKSATLQEDLLEPLANTHFPWSDGPQNCLGAKFAQVEFVAVTAALLYKHRLEVLPNKGESVERARQRCL